MATSHTEGTHCEVVVPGTHCVSVEPSTHCEVVVVATCGGVVGTYAEEDIHMLALFLDARAESPIPEEEQYLALHVLCLSQPSALVVATRILSPSPM